MAQWLMHHLRSCSVELSDYKYSLIEYTNSSHVFSGNIGSTCRNTGLTLTITTPIRNGPDCMCQQEEQFRTDRAIRDK